LKIIFFKLKLQGCQDQRCKRICKMDDVLDCFCIVPCKRSFGWYSFGFLVFFL